jgi:hypothetical protein
VPLLGEFTTPVSNLGFPAPNVYLQLKAGGMVDRREAGLSQFEVFDTPDFTTSASVTKTQINPAAGFGFLYQAPGSPLSFGVQTIFDFQQPINFTAQSMPFPSAFYMESTGHQISTTALFIASYSPLFAQGINFEGIHH